MKANSNQVGEIILVEAVKQAKQEFGSRLIACYALGSLAHGGFSPQVSDVDLAIILTSPLTVENSHQIEVIKNHVKSLPIPLSERLSIFWGSLASLRKEETGGRFPPLDKLDLIAHGRLLAGNEVRTTIPKPTRREMEVSSSKFALNFLGTSEMNKDLLQPTNFFDKGVVLLTKIVLFPVRFLYTASTGDIGRNDIAVAHYLENNQGNKAELVNRAFRWRCEQPVCDEDTTKLMEKALIPLYLQFIDTYYCKMLDYKEINLAENLKQWRHELSSFVVTTS
ncbi:MAG: nucleotidyltransferase domain-containing protein [Symploca sp. SIO2D2]|nr:nucleotidyltransferase domain-containing protein [Symploca sp. SIO2D2]